MRTTQFVGLTNDAEKFVSSLDEVESSAETFGMFQEKIPLRRWEWPGAKRQRFLQEVLQDSPWSSGPMLFTCLEVIYIQDGEEQKSGTIFNWVPDPTVTGECDSRTGRYWV